VVLIKSRFPGQEGGVMNVAIAGGHGQIALVLTEILRDNGDRVRSIIRNADQSEDVRNAGGEPVVCDLEAASEADVTAAVGPVDAIVFAAGAGPGSGSARKETMDYGGAVKVITAARANGISRYVMISSTGADASASGDDTFRVYLRAKGRADDDLIASGLDYTIIRPVRLTNEPATGLVRVGASVGRGTIGRADVAGIVATALVEDVSIGKVFDAKSGDVPIADALRQL